jgi:hypothetical protein
LPVLWVAVALAARGFLAPLWNVTMVAIRQVLVPPDLHGRVSAALRMVAHGAVPVGGALGQAFTEPGLPAPMRVASADPGAGQGSQARGMPWTGDLRLVSYAAHAK